MAVEVNCDLLRRHRHFTHPSWYPDHKDSETATVELNVRENHQNATTPSGQSNQMPALDERLNFGEDEKSRDRRWPTCFAFTTCNLRNSSWQPHPKISPRSQAVCVERPSFGLLGSTRIRLGLEPSPPIHRRNTCANAQRDVDENIASKCMCAEDVNESARLYSVRRSCFGQSR
ncbi:uncharacterized protein K489DRAFT_206162 [Dissoconium aciculare CBS 342.82]|uniref:Uncharacterized protein n=1 Tax=Dissoconium aciculare CBS 342.82 TaxID=1314786 RepID=A0A6J3M837_9PEZI|nr:uncharacterized protein K489DRAFT_206162 [Dissoconium aciculare CBS 342.82]KAF1823749.1 hypothetical protein K489DRAFT_206162 [Dissoconium aciculare CBS 342.82]